MKTNSTIEPRGITPATTTASVKETAKVEPKSKVVSVTIEIQRKQAKKLEKAASLIGISLSRLVELKLGQA